MLSKYNKSDDNEVHNKKKKRKLPRNFSKERNFTRKFSIILYFFIPKKIPIFFQEISSSLIILIFFSNS